VVTSRLCWLLLIGVRYGLQSRKHEGHALLRADTNAIRGGDTPFSVLSAAHGIADTHMVEANRDPEEVLCEALRVLLRYVRETPELGHSHEVLPGIPHRPEKSRDASLLPAQKLSTLTHIPASDEP